MVGSASAIRQRYQELSPVLDERGGGGLPPPKVLTRATLSPVSLSLDNQLCALAALDGLVYRRKCDIEIGHAAAPQVMGVGQQRGRVASRFDNHDEFDLRRMEDFSGQQTHGGGAAEPGAALLTHRPITGASLRDPQG
jgi:hypothetical protein